MRVCVCVCVQTIRVKFNLTRTVNNREPSTLNPRLHLLPAGAEVDADALVASAVVVEAEAWEGIGDH